MIFLNKLRRSTRHRIILYALFVVLSCAVLFALLNFSYIKFRMSELWRDSSGVPVEQLVVIRDDGTIEPNLLVVESLSIQAPIQYVTEQRETVFQEALQRGVVHYPGTAKPGQSGNVYIFGHSSDFAWTPGEYKTVLAKLPDIKKGAEIKISDESGKVYTYLVVGTKVVDPKDTSVLAQDLSKKVLTVQTSYPIGTALKRFLVIAELVVR